MAKKKTARTSGYQWLEHSVAAFNGSGYADYDSPEAFMESYIDYNKWKRRPEAVRLAQQYYHAILSLAKHLIEDTNHAGQVPNARNLAKFQASRQIRII